MERELLFRNKLQDIALLSARQNNFLLGIVIFPPNLSSAPLERGEGMKGGGDIKKEKKVKGIKLKILGGGREVKLMETYLSLGTC